MIRNYKGDAIKVDVLPGFRSNQVVPEVIPNISFKLELVFKSMEEFNEWYAKTLETK